MEITNESEALAGDLPFSMVPYLPKAAARDSSLVSKLSPPMNSLPSSDILSPTTKHKGKKNTNISSTYGRIYYLSCLKDDRQGAPWLRQHAPRNLGQWSITSDTSTTWVFVLNIHLALFNKGAFN